MGIPWLGRPERFQESHRARLVVDPVAGDAVREREMADTCRSRGISRRPSEVPEELVRRTIDLLWKVDGEMGYRGRRKISVAERLEKPDYAS